MSLYVIGKPESLGRAVSGATRYPDTNLQALQYSDAAELSGPVLETENQGTVRCAPGSMACKADLTEFFQFDGATQAWVKAGEQ